MKCVQCSTETRKYKCSKCISYCCSFDCYKTHKAENVCSNLETDRLAPPNEVEVPVEITPRTLTPFRTDDTVDAARLAQLGNSDALKGLLRNNHLRKFLIEVDTAPNAWKAMRVAMLEPLFVEFADECMKIVEPDA